ncbi:MAG: glycosyltransferase family 39 protein [Polyangiaceae bacterium]
MNAQEIRIAIAMGATASAIHLSTAAGYGWFRDELYYVACGEHLAFGYVDHPPLVALLARTVRLLGHESPIGLRAFAAMVGGATVALTGIMAAQFGAGAFGVALAALCALVAPLILSVNGFFSMNVLDFFFWALASSIALSILQGATSLRRWLALGMVVGIGLENKLSMAFFAAGLALGMLTSKAREHLRTRGPWLAAALALALWLPNLVWNARMGWPNLEFMNNARLYKHAARGPFAFLFEQFMQMHPVTAVVWLTGLATLLFRRDKVSARPLAVTYLFTLIAFMTSHGKAYYVGPAYLVLFAAGAARLEAVVRSVKARTAALVAMVAFGAGSAPLVLPVLTPQTLVGYLRWLGQSPGAAEKGRQAEIPQRFADQFGWDSLTIAVAQARDKLEPAERGNVGIFAQNYGEAGAIDVLGRRFGLPPAMSAHNTYWLWGPKGQPQGPILVIGGNVDDHRAYCGEVTALSHRSCRFCMPSEQQLTVYACRHPKASMRDIWPRLKHFD